MSRRFYQSKALVLCLMFICSIFSTLIQFETQDEDLIEIIPVKFSTSADQDYRFYFEELTQQELTSNPWSGNNADGKIEERMKTSRKS